MKIDNSIKKMEEALAKKKALRAEKSVGRIASLKERIKVKAAKIRKLTEEVGKMNAEAAELIGDTPGEEEEVNFESNEGKSAAALAAKDAEIKEPPAKSPTASKASGRTRSGK